MRLRLVAPLLAMLLVSVGVLAQNDPLIATWKLNLAKSKYNPGPPPKSPTTLKITAAAGGIRVVADGVNAQGQTTHSEYTAKFDGKDYPRPATAGGKPDGTAYDSIALKKIDAYNVDATEKLKGQMLGVAHWTFSQDGKTRTVTGTVKDAQGQPTNNTLVYDRQ
jgi:hypothetical protein